MSLAGMDRILRPPVPPGLSSGARPPLPASMSSAVRPAPTSVPNGGSPRSDSGVNLAKWQAEQMRGQPQRMPWQKCGNDACDGGCGMPECFPPPSWRDVPVRLNVLAHKPKLEASQWRAHPFVCAMAWLVLQWRWHVRRMR